MSRLTSQFAILLHVLVVLLVGGSLTDMHGRTALGDEGPNEYIEIRNPISLPTKIACERVAVGEQGDYKPCVVKLPSGELLIVAFHGHQLAGGRIREDILLFRSSDGGRTWSDVETLELLGREPYFSILSNGTLLITVHFLKQDIRNKEGYVYSLLHRSTDGGKTWQSTTIGWEDVPGAPEQALIVTSRNVLELQDGTVTLGVSAAGGLDYLWRSKDQGETWDKTLACSFAGVDTSKVRSPLMGETVFWQGRSGDLLGLVRVDQRHFPPIAGTTIPRNTLDQYNRLLLYRSQDGGRNWKEEELGSYYGEMYPAILRLKDGRLLMTFTLRSAVAPNVKPLGVRCIVGRETDDAFQFDFKQDRIILDTKTPHDSISGGGFGPTVQLDDSTLVTAFSYAGKGGWRGHDFHIEVVRWRLPEPKTHR